MKNRFFLLWLYVPLSIIQATVSVNMTVLAKTLEQFKNYTTALHFENSQTEELQDLLTLTSKDIRPIYLINYDNHKQKSELFENRLVHVIFLKRTYHLSKYTLIDNHDTVILVSKISIDRNKKMEMCKQKKLFKTKNVIIIANESFFACCYYCSKKKVTLRTIQKRNGSVPVFRQLFNKYRDFGGYTFNIGYEIYPPFFYRKFKNNHRNFGGPESALLNVGEKLMNYKYNLNRYTGNTTNGVKDIMIDEVRLGKIDWIIGGVSQTLMRTKTPNIEFTRYIQFQSYMVVYEKTEDSRSFTNRSINFWYISNWHSLLLTVIGVTGVAFVIKLSLRCSRKFSYSFGDYALMVMVYLIEQQSTKLKRNIKLWRSYIKLLFIFWLFTSTYLLANYKSVQAYFLMTSQTGPNNIDDLVRKGYKLQVENTDFTNIKLHCQFFASEFCSKTLKKLEVFEDNLCTSIRDVLNSKVALIQEEEPLEFTALRKCNLTIQEKQSLRFVPAKIIPQEWHAWPFQKSTPFVGAFSHLISRVESTGLLRHWYTREIQVYSNFYSSVVTEWQREKRALNMYDFSYCFSFLIAGYIVCLIVYLMELFYFKFKPINIKLNYAQ